MDERCDATARHVGEEEIRDVMTCSAVEVEQVSEESWEVGGWMWVLLELVIVFGCKENGGSDNSCSVHVFPVKC